MIKSRDNVIRLRKQHSLLPLHLFSVLLETPITYLRSILQEPLVEQEQNILPVLSGIRIVHVRFCYFSICFERRFVSVICIYLRKLAPNTISRWRFVSFTINTTGVTSGAGTDYISGAPQFTTGVQWGSYNLLFSVFCILLLSSFIRPLYFVSLIYSF